MKSASNLDQNSLESRSPTTITSIIDLKKSLESIRAQVCAINNGEYHPLYKTLNILSHKHKEVEL